MSVYEHDKFHNSNLNHVLIHFSDFRLSCDIL